MFTRNYRLLAYFVEVVECLSIRGAARKLFVSAPVVSKAINDLEDSLGVTLLNRRKGVFEITEEGRKVYFHALEMTSAAVRAIDAIDSAKNPISGHLDVNLSTALASTWLPPLLKKFQLNHPQVTIEIIASDDLAPANQLQSQITIRAEFTLQKSADQNRYFCHLPLCMALSPELLPNKQSTHKNLLNNLMIIGFTQAVTSNYLNVIDLKTGEKHSVTFKPATIVNNAQVIKELVCQGYGASLLIEQSIAKELESKQLVSLSDRYHFGYTGLLTKFRDRYPSPAARAFNRLLIESANTD